MLEQQIQERAADSTAALALGSWSISLVGVNVLLETVTLALGVVAAAFSVYFHVRRALRERRLRREQEKS